jgi:hypothetical protein
MPALKTRLVRYRSSGHEALINETDFDPALHADPAGVQAEEAPAAEALPEAQEAEPEKDSSRGRRRRS